MLSAVELATRAGVTISAVTCRNDHARWSEPEVREDYLVVLVRRGRFRRHAARPPCRSRPNRGLPRCARGGTTLRHPVGGDVCTSVSLVPDQWWALAGKPVTRTTMYVDARLDLAHRRVLAAASTGDLDYALAEGLLDLLTSALDQLVAAHPRRAPDPAPTTTRSSRPREKRSPRQ